MVQLIAQRLAQAALTLSFLAIAIFVLSRLSGDPVELMLPVDATVQDRQMLRQTLGLDEPVLQQFARFVGGVLTGDLGISIRERRPALDLVLERLPNSLGLAVVSLVMAIVMAFPLAIAAAVWKGTAIDTATRIFAVLGQSFPTFWVGLVLIILFAGELRVLPAGGMGGWAHYILPGFTLGWFVVAGMMRLLRSSMLEVLDSEYVKLARIKGMPEYVVIWKHALRNALVPVVTFGGVYLALLISTAVIVETVFAWPGLGRLAYDAIRFRDFPVTQAVVLFTALIVVASSFVVDLLYLLIDPRIRAGTKGDARP